MVMTTNIHAMAVDVATSDEHSIREWLAGCERHNLKWEAELYRIALGIKDGSRCPHGYPDQGDGCVECNG